MAVSRRIEKINKLLNHEVAGLLLTELDLPPEIIVTVVGVDTSPDLKYANVLISILPADKTGSTLSSINKKIYKIQKTIDRHLAMRPVPKIKFSIASPIDNHLDKLFDEIKKENESPSEENQKAD